MKLSLLFLVVVFFQMQANSGYSQRTKIDLNLLEEPLSTSFEEIESKTEFKFFYKNEEVNLNRKVSIQIKKGNINKILNHFFSGTNITYKVKGKHIILKQRSGKGVMTLPQQEIEINGMVTDQNGLPIPGATIIIKDAQRGAATNLDGEYTITTPTNAILIFSYIGYKKQEIAVDGREEIDIQLEKDIASLDEVKINAGYYNTTERERTGNISRLTAEEIERQPVLNPLAAIQGRVAGVHITESSGVPGAGYEMRIRGQNSLRDIGNNPLYIIDGVPFSSTTMEDLNVSGGIMPGYGGSPLNMIEPSSITSIEILKDADATAIYGSRGANGVILITTKKGKEGKTSFQVDLESGISEVGSQLELLNTEQYFEMRKEAFANDGITDYPDYAYDINGTWDANRQTDWQKKLIGNTAFHQKAQANLSGGSKQTQFYMGGGFQQRETVFPGDYNYTRISGQARVNHRALNERLNLALSVNYSSDNNHLPTADFTREALLLSPNAPTLYDDNGELNWEDGTWENPLRHLETTYRAKSKNLITNLVIDYELVNNLHAKASLGYIDSQLNSYRTNPHTFYNPSYGFDSSFSSLITNSSQRNSYLIEPQLDWTHQWKKLRIKALVGTSFQQQDDQQDGLYAEGFASNSLLLNPASASNIFVSNSLRSTYKHQAVFARLNLNLKNRYLLNLTGRRDGSSRFGSNNKFGNFGAVGAAWLFHKEAFVSKALPWLSHGKLRTSYGITGNDQIGDYQYLDTYANGANNYGGLVTMQPTRLYNPQFGWEENLKWEAALEVEMFEDRISWSLAHFRNRSSNQLVGVPMPGTTGFSSLQANLDATLENTGWEIGLSFQPVQTDEINWKASINFSKLTNKLISFPNLEASTYANQYVIGAPLGIVKIFNSEGIDPQTGYYSFEDTNNDGEISSPEDQQSYINTQPEFFGGFQNSISYNNFQLDFLLQGVKQVGANYLTASAFPGAMNNQPVEVLNRWQATGDTQGVQRYTSGLDAEASRVYNLYSRSDAAYSDASFIRLKTLSLSYELPKKYLGNLRLTLYGRGQNLWTLTNYRGLDPENQSLTQLPPLRVWSFGTRINF